MMYTSRVNVPVYTKEYICISKYSLHKDYSQCDIFLELITKASNPNQRFNSEEYQVNQSMNYDVSNCIETQLIYFPCMKIML